MAHDLVFLHGKHDPHCTATVDKHFDGYCTVQFMTRGRLELFYDDVRYELRPPSVWPAQPGPHIRFHRAPGCASWDHRYVAFKGTTVGHWRAEGLLLTRPQTVRNPRKFAQRFDELLAQIGRTDAWGVRLAANTLEALLLELADQRGPSEQAIADPWLDRILAQLEQSIGHADIDYDRLADAQSMSLSTLRRRFRQTTGTPIHAYILQLRMGEARRLLGDGDLPIKAVADQLGYSDVFYFSRQFRQITGVPPAVYRKSRQR